MRVIFTCTRQGRKCHPRSTGLQSCDADDTERGPYRFCFVSAVRYEPPHIHVRRDDGFAKFWLDPVELQSSGNFSRPELRRVLRSVERNQARFSEDWDGYFDR